MCAIKKKSLVFLIAAVLLFSFSANADHLDVIPTKLQADCSLPEYLQIVNDFNEWAKSHGYRAEIAVPLHSHDVATLIWVGRSANAETFGKAWDTWRDAQADPGSTPAKLQARLNACSEPIEQRRSFDTYP